MKAKDSGPSLEVPFDLFAGCLELGHGETVELPSQLRRIFPKAFEEGTPQGPGKAGVTQQITICLCERADFLSGQAVP
jgi:hypothetical protein